MRNAFTCLITCTHTYTPSHTHARTQATPRWLAASHSLSLTIFGVCFDRINAHLLALGHGHQKKPSSSVASTRTATTASAALADDDGSDVATLLACFCCCRWILIAWLLLLLLLIFIYHILNFIIFFRSIFFGGSLANTRGSAQMLQLWQISIRGLLSFSSAHSTTLMGQQASKQASRQAGSQTDALSPPLAGTFQCQLRLKVILLARGVCIAHTPGARTAAGVSKLSGHNYLWVVFCNIK